AFEFILAGSQNEIRDYVAFGLFMQSENEWASQKELRTDAEYKKYHENLLTPRQKERLRGDAEKVLSNFAAQAISAEESAVLGRHRKFRLFGVTEAVLGAFIWTVILIVVSILAARAGIDILEYYKKAAGIH